MLPERFRLYRLLLLASPLAVLPALNFYWTAAGLEGFVRGQGVVVQNHCYSARTAVRLCVSRIEFQGIDGRTHAYWDRTATSWEAPLGEPVALLMSPAVPGHAVRAGIGGVWAGPAIIGLLGWGVYLAVLVGTLVAARAQRRRLQRLAQRRLARNAREREARRLRREAKAAVSESLSP